VFFFITSTILSLHSAPQENRYWNANLKVCVGFSLSVWCQQPQLPSLQTYSNQTLVCWLLKTMGRSNENSWFKPL
jgi:hypothetical protein